MRMAVWTMCSADNASASSPKLPMSPIHRALCLVVASREVLQSTRLVTIKSLIRDFLFPHLGLLHATHEHDQHHGRPLLRWSEQKLRSIGNSLKAKRADRAQRPTKQNYANAFTASERWVFRNRFAISGQPVPTNFM